MAETCLRPVAVALLVLLAATQCPAADEAIRVEVYENLPEKGDFAAPSAPPTDSYSSPALAFTRVPDKYSARGIELDRSNPFVLHAETTLKAPEGPHRLILRARNAAKLIV